ncbi:unnamed protein product [Agarophyton chilense]
MLMRWLNHLTRSSHDGLYGIPNTQPYGILDRRPSAIMFYARIISGTIAFTACIFSISFAGLPTPRNSHQSVVTDTGQHPTSDVQTPADPLFLNGIRQETSDGTELVFQKVSNPRGTILLLHGCSHSATDWFPPSAFCRECIGLPEEMKIVYQSLLRGYSVLAVSSTNRKRKCWHTHPEARLGMDYKRIDSALNAAKELTVYDAARPLFAVGVSSGGLFASSLPLRSPVVAVNSIVSSSVIGMWAEDFARKKTTYVPHVFTHMAFRDGRTTAMVASSMSKLLNLGVPCTEFRVDPKAVTPQFLIQAIPHLNHSLASQIVSALNSAGHLDSVWRLKSDPRGSSWRNAIQHLQSNLRDLLVADASSLSEELNRAWAAHEITSEYYEETLNFFEKSATTSFHSL